MPICTSLDQIGPIWTYLDVFGPIWMYLDLSGPIWTSRKALQPMQKPACYHYFSINCISISLLKNSNHPCYPCVSIVPISISYYEYSFVHAVLTLKSILPLLSLSYLPKIWSTNTLAFSQDKTSWYISTILFLLSRPSGLSSRNPLGKFRNLRGKDT